MTFPLKQIKPIIQGITAGKRNTSQGADCISPWMPLHRLVCSRSADFFSQSLGKGKEGKKLVGNPAFWRRRSSSFGHFQGQYSLVTTFGIGGKEGKKSPLAGFIHHRHRQERREASSGRQGVRYSHPSIVRCQFFSGNFPRKVAFSVSES